MNTQVHSTMVHVFAETTMENMDKITKLTVIPHVWPRLTRFVEAVVITQSTEHQVINYINISYILYLTVTVKTVMMRAPLTA